MTTNLISKIPVKYHNRIHSLEKFPSWAGGSPYRLQLVEGYETHEGGQVFQADTLKEVKWVIRNSIKIGGNN